MMEGAVQTLLPQQDPWQDWGKLVIQQEKRLQAKVADLSSLSSMCSGPEAIADDEETESKEETSLLQKLLHKQLVTCNSDIEFQRRNPSHPLYSVKSFDSLRLKPELLQGVYTMGFNAPSKIQETALPALLADPPMNMIAQSQSGTGKTAAFVLTMLSRVDTNNNWPQCLCLSPTYELALQTGQVLMKMGAFMKNLTVAYAVRGEKGRRNIEDHIVIGTPGTVLDWMRRGNLAWMDRIRVFVLDEADVLISIQGYQHQSSRIHRHLSDSCQILLFSATYEESVMDFACHIVADPLIIRLRREEETLDNILQFYFRCRSLEEKYRAICNIYGSISVGQSIIFCRKRSTASWLAESLIQDHHAVALLTGELTIEQRAAMIQSFRQGQEKVLITTNVSARGIDVVMVTVVVNFDLPVTVDMTADYETYLHRIGRAGRFGKQGLAINMVDSDQSMDILHNIEEHFGRKITKLDVDDLDAMEKISN